MEIVWFDVGDGIDCFVEYVVEIVEFVCLFDCGYVFGIFYYVD